MVHLPRIDGQRIWKPQVLYRFVFSMGDFLATKFGEEWIGDFSATWGICWGNHMVTLGCCGARLIIIHYDSDKVFCAKSDQSYPCVPPNLWYSPIYGHFERENGGESGYILRTASCVIYRPICWWFEAERPNQTIPKPCVVYSCMVREYTPVKQEEVHGTARFQEAND